MMLSTDPMVPLESIYMDDHLRFYESESAKPGIAYCDLQPIGFENQDQVTANMAQVENSNQRALSFEDIPDLDTDHSWQFKPPDQWHSSDLIEWLFHWAAQHRMDLLDVNTLGFNNFTGQDLCRMTRNEFCSIDSQYGGALYDSLQYLLAQYRATPPAPPDIQVPTIRTEHEPIDPGEWARERCNRWSTMVDLDAQGPSPYSGCESDRESASSSLSTVNERTDLSSMYLQSNRINIKPEPVTLPYIKKVGRRGRPPKKDGKSRSKQAKGTGKLWEFIRDLLLNPATNPSLIRWERREDGIFKFVQSDKVARLWGDRKQNPRMTYEKLSRAMRYYYKSQVLLPVFGRRLVYKFGPNASGWRPMLHPSAM